MSKDGITTKKLIILLIINTVLMFFLYLLGQAWNLTVTMVSFAVLSAGFCFSYIIYNRGFSRKGIKYEMLPPEWSEERKREFIESGEKRLKKSKWMLTILLPMLFIYGYELVDLFFVPIVLRLFERA